ncbi:MAG: hypothetical protein M1831_005268 [Alyxoria varia]|nr:MAG: hypothetical protein M1831_005268 [Alyxoria varia]
MSEWMLKPAHLAIWVVEVVVSLIMTKVFLSVYSSFANARKAKQLGCQPVPRYPRPVWDFLGLKLLRSNLAAADRKQFPDFLMIRNNHISDLLGRTTYTYSMDVLNNEMLFTSDPKNIQTMLATQFHDFSLSPNRKGNFDPLLGRGIFTSDGKAWEHDRSLLRPNFTRERVGDLELEGRHNEKLGRALVIRQDGWTDVVDLQPLFFRLTLDSSTEFLFGESVDSQLMQSSQFKTAAPFDSKKDHSKSLRDEDFASAFDLAQAYTGWRARLGARYWLVTNKEFREACRTCHSYIDYYVQSALSKEPVDDSTTIEKGKTEEKDGRSGDGGGGGGGGSGKYVFLKELMRQTRDPIELRSQLLHVLLAGRDTTASLLSWLFYLLARNPEAFARLRSVIIEDFGADVEEADNNNSSSSGNTITFAKLKGCQTLQHYLSEALRLYPVVPTNTRHAVKDTSLPRGGGPDGSAPIFVKQGQDVSYSVYLLHRHKELWGPDAEEFKPERWVGRRPGWDFVPFNGGPRICLGQQFALTSASFATVKLLQRFDKVENMDQTPDVLKHAAVTMQSDRGVVVKLRAAKT